MLSGFHSSVLLDECDEDRQPKLISSYLKEQLTFPSGPEVSSIQKTIQGKYFLFLGQCASSAPTTRVNYLPLDCIVVEAKSK